ncbi:MAG: XVIPCD domain-containing protein [Pseudomonadota bacterium]
MNEKVKVGLDEWIVADRTKTDLMTDGLNGCVAVGLAKGDRISLSHVYSECTAETWDAYKDKLESALAESGMGDLHGSKAVLVCSQGNITEGSSAFLPQKLKAWLESKGAEVAIHKDAGCTISAADGALKCTLKKDVDADLYRFGFKTSSDEPEGLLRRNKLSGEGKAAGLPHASQADKDYTGPLLSSEAHPANGLFKAIMDKLPEEAEDYGNTRNIAAALTVRALRKGIDSVDEVAIGSDGRLFALQGSAEAGKRAFVEMGQVDDHQIRFSSREAADLHRAMAPVAASSSPQAVVEPQVPKSL